jgi:predicted ATPase
MPNRRGRSPQERFIDLIDDFYKTEHILPFSGVAAGAVIINTLEGERMGQTFIHRPGAFP